MRQNKVEFIMEVDAMWSALLSIVITGIGFWVKVVDERDHALTDPD